MCDCLRVARKSSKTGLWKDEVIYTAEKKNTAWKDVLGENNEIMKGRCMKI